METTKAFGANARYTGIKLYNDKIKFYSYELYFYEPH
jgi:hypothetical protein